MIKSTTLENFQSHTLSELKFHEGVNVITGVSDSGKSSIIRAWYWLIHNRPSGEDFKNWKAHKKDQVAVEVMTDKDTFAIIRSDGKTTYSTNEQNFSAIKTDVPSEISEALNITDYNLQTQFQPYFLLQDSPGEVARKLNELVGLDIIDLLYKNLSSEIRTTNAELTMKQKQWSETKEQLMEFASLADIEKLITNIEENYRESLEIKLCQDHLKEVIDNAALIEKEKEKLNKVIKYSPRVDKNLLLIEEGLLLYEKKNNLKEIIDQIYEVVHRDIELNNLWLELEKPCDALLKQIKESQNISDATTNLSTIIQSLCNIKNQQQKGIEKLDESKTQYVELLNEAKVCPVCSSKIDNTILKSIKENL